MNSVFVVYLQERDEEPFMCHICATLDAAKPTHDPAANEPPLVWTKDEDVSRWTAEVQDTEYRWIIVEWAVLG